MGMGSRSHRIRLGGRHRAPYRLPADLRLARERRSGILLARGYRYFRHLHVADPVALYTTVIYEGNDAAMQALVGGRAGLPLYRDWGRLLTPALHLDLPVRQARLPGVEIERGSGGELPQIVAFLNSCWRHKQFAPVFREQDLVHGRFAGLAPQDFFLARRNGRIVAAWRPGTSRRCAKPMSSATRARCGCCGQRTTRSPG